MDVAAHVLRCGTGEAAFVVSKLNLLELKVQGGAKHIFSAVFEAGDVGSKGFSPAAPLSRVDIR